MKKALTEEKADNTRVLYWSRFDTPIPKKGQVLTNMFNERYKVISAVKQGDDIEITLSPII
jgi:hypothetical protein